jgi:predicted metal-dependent enzyme (double-stranded beta helix superfamily)
MQIVAGSYSIRQCAQDLIRLLAANQNNLAKAEQEAIPYLQRLMERPDLFELGVKREGNHTGESLWLYYDYDLSIMTARMPKGTAVPVHNHGTWEVVGVYRGAIKYTMYERVDDGSQRFYSDLKVVEDRIMRPVDVSICPPPPHDLHGFTALTDETYIVAVVGGPYAPVREYHNPAEHYYIERHQQAWRVGERPAER